MVDLKRVILPLVVLGAATCAVFVLPPTLIAPFAAPLLAQTQVRYAACPSIQLALNGSYLVQSLAVLPDGFAVFYRAACDDVSGSTTPTEAFRVVKRGWLSWRDLGGEDISYYDAGCVQPTSTGQSICCTVSLGENEQYTAVFGRAVSPDAQWVEVVFDNGDVTRVGVIGEKFVIASPVVMHSGLIRVLNSAGGLLDSTPLDLSDDARASGTTGCLP